MLARRTRYSPAQVRKLERQGVIPPARRAANGYRLFSAIHELALNAYRGLAVAVGPVTASDTIRTLWTIESDAAAARISRFHLDLSKERAEALAAQDALRLISGENNTESPAHTDDSMTIGQLAAALDVRASTLRFWEQAGLLRPERVTSRRIRSYPPETVRYARIIAALRNAGYRIPEIRETLTAAHELRNVDAALETLKARLAGIAARTRSLLRAGTDLAALLDALSH